MVSCLVVSALVLNKKGLYPTLPNIHHLACQYLLIIIIGQSTEYNSHLVHLVQLAHPDPKTTTISVH